MSIESTLFNIDNPVFHAYTLTGCIMILKLMLQPWMTVVRIMSVHAGFRSPEDMKKSPLNPNPNASQLEVNEYVDRSRRMNLNDLENIPGFLAAGFFLVMSNPPVLLAQILLWTFVASRGAHFVAYATAQLHDVRATFWTIGSVCVIVMTGYALVRLV